MAKYFLTVETERVYEHWFEAETEADAKKYVDEYVLDDEDLMYHEVTSVNWTSTGDEDANV